MFNLICVLILISGRRLSCLRCDVSAALCAAAERARGWRVFVLLPLLQSPAVLRVSGGVDGSCGERSVGDSLSVATAPGSV